MLAYGNEWCHNMSSQNHVTEKKGNYRFFHKDGWLKLENLVDNNACNIYSAKQFCNPHLQVLQSWIYFLNFYWWYECRILGSQMKCIILIWINPYNVKMSLV